MFKSIDTKTALCPIESAGSCLARSSRGFLPSSTFDRKQFAVIFICSTGAKVKISFQQICCCHNVGPQMAPRLLLSARSCLRSQEDEECFEPMDSDTESQSQQGEGSWEFW